MRKAGPKPNEVEEAVRLEEWGRVWGAGVRQAVPEKPGKWAGQGIELVSGATFGKLRGRQSPRLCGWLREVSLRATLPAAALSSFARPVAA